MEEYKQHILLRGNQLLTFKIIENPNLQTKQKHESCHIFYRGWVIFSFGRYLNLTEFDLRLSQGE